MTQKQKNEVESALIEFIIRTAKAASRDAVAALPDTVLALVELNKINPCC